MNAQLIYMQSLILVVGSTEHEAPIEHYKDSTPHSTTYTAPTDFFKDAASLQQDPPCSTCDRPDSICKQIQNTMTQKRPLFSREGFRYGSGRPVTLANVINCCQRIDFVHVPCSHCPADEAELGPVCSHSYEMATPSCIE